MYNVTNPKTGKTYTYRDLRRADALARKLGVPVRHTWGYTTRSGERLSVPHNVQGAGRCPHGSTYGFCDRGACDE